MEPAAAGRFRVRPLPGERTWSADQQGASPRAGRGPGLPRSVQAGRHAARHAALKCPADGSDRSKPEEMPVSAFQVNRGNRKGDNSSPPPPPCPSAAFRCGVFPRVRLLPRWQGALFASMPPATWSGRYQTERVITTPGWRFRRLV